MYYRDADKFEVDVYVIENLPDWLVGVEVKEQPPLLRKTIFVG